MSNFDPPHSSDVFAGRSANPDPAGVFSKTEYDLAAAKGMNAPQPEAPPPQCAMRGCAEPAQFINAGFGLCATHQKRIKIVSMGDIPVIQKPPCVVKGCPDSAWFDNFGVLVCPWHNARLRIEAI